MCLTGNRKTERRKEHLEAECKRIHDKESKFDDLTPGQITALLTHERSLEHVNAELEDLEDAMQTSILEKLNPSAAKVSVPLFLEFGFLLGKSGCKERS